MQATTDPAAWMALGESPRTLRLRAMLAQCDPAAVTANRDERHALAAIAREWPGTPHTARRKPERFGLLVRRVGCTLPCGGSEKRTHEQDPFRSRNPT